MKYIIVDDNKMARMALKQIASGIAGIELVSECASAAEAYNFVQQSKVDFVLLDIEMPELTGLEFAPKLASLGIYVIFTTGKTEYAIDAFATNVVDYIVKPVSQLKLINAIEKLKELVSKKLGPETNNTNYFFVKDRGALHKVELKDVLYFEAMGDYVKIHTNEKSFAIHSTLKKIEDKINSYEFIRVHRSYIVSLLNIHRIEDGLIEIQGHHIPLADSYKSALNSKLNLL